MRIVLVDPSRTVLKFVTRLLEARQHEVRAFTDGRAALDCIKADADVAALITSAEPITMSGLELCWEARVLASGRRPIYVIMMSSNRGAHSLGEALDSGADDFISKPPVADELYARLRAAERFASLQRDLYRLATTDPLTGALNRRAFFEKARDAIETAGREMPLAALMMDIDHFKRINDGYGHDIGDEAICAVAREAMAEDVVFGRLGGEEFAALLPGRDLGAASALAERLRLHIAGLRFETAHGPMTLTCSFGVSEWHDGDTIDALLKRGDVALYAAKTGGRNRVVAADAAFRVARDSGTSVIRSSARAVDASPSAKGARPAEPLREQRSAAG